MGFFRKVGETMKPKTYINADGYWCFTDTHYPIHRWVAKKKIGRDLRKGEVVHHINYNKRDNSEDNLHICSNQSEHERIHRLDRIFRKGIGVEIVTKRTYIAIEIIPIIIKVLIVVVVVYFILELLEVI